MFVRIHTVNSPFVTAFHITYILYNEHTTRNILVSPIQNDTDVQTEVRTHCPGPITFISLQSTTKVEKIFWASPAGRKLSFLGGGISPQEMSRWNTGIRVCVCVCAIEPNHERAASNLLYYKQSLADMTQQQQQPCSDDVDDEPVNLRPMDTYKASAEFQLYERLCRGEQTHVRVCLCVYTVNNIKNGTLCSRSYIVCSTIGYHSNSWTYCYYCNNFV